MEFRVVTYHRVNMALDDFSTDGDSGGVSLKTRKRLDNVTFDEQTWTNLVASHPFMASMIAKNTSNAGAKAIAKKLKEGIDNELRGHNVGDQSREEMRKAREEIIEYLKD